MLAVTGETAATGAIRENRNQANMSDNTEWATPQKILVVLAHPDDPEFFCGATIARWTKQGHQVAYCLLTRGDKGGSDLTIRPEELSARREVEQRAAAACLGVHSVQFLDFQDGYLTPDLTARMAVVRAIRAYRPDVLVSCDPTNYFPRENYLNHPDHRAAGQIVVDAVFPAAGNPYFFPELIREEGLQPHSVRELWLSLTASPNLILDVTSTWGDKVSALHQHRSQIGPDTAAFDERMAARRVPESDPAAPRFEERFRRLVFQG
jgi:LmbE family N-acetylglucosaminyl deacetylase